MKIKQYEFMYEREDKHWWFQSKRRFIATLLPLLPRKLSLLEVGSGTGGTSIYLERWGSVIHLEPSPYAARYLRKRNITFLPVSIQNYDQVQKNFDGIFILDVLYHKEIKNDLLVLKKLYNLLKPGGFLCLTDCAIPQLMSHHDSEVEARQRYTKTELIKKIHKAHFQIERISYMYCLVFPLFVIQRIADKIFALNTVSMPPIWLNNLLNFLCKIEALCLRFINLPIGSSLIVIARKPLFETTHEHHTLGSD